MWRMSNAQALIFIAALRLECGVGFRQLRTSRHTRPGQLWGQKLTEREATN
jgi:hypothetical protein